MYRQMTVAALVLTAAAIAVFGGNLSSNQPAAYGLVQQTVRGTLHRRFIHIGSVTRRLPGLSGGLRFSAVEAFRALGGGEPSRMESGKSRNVSVLPAQVSLGCANRTSFGDVRVNQDCTLRRQAEEDIAFNPVDTQNLIAGQNDSSIGWNHCGFDYSLDGGLHWGSGTPPFYARLNQPPSGHTIYSGPGASHTYDAASDPSVAFGAGGNAYFSCILFDIKDNAGAIYVTRSPAGADGSFYNVVPPAPSTGRDPGNYVVVEDDSADATPDEEKIAADTFAHSPYRGSVYVAWTEFMSGPSCTQGGQCYSSIYFSRSTNQAKTWSKPVEISGNSATLCFAGNQFDPRRKPHDCDFDEGAQPIVLSNGNVVVLFNNSNTSGVNPDDQILAVVSKDGGRTWSRPVLVGEDVVMSEPQCNTGDGDGPEECIPGPFIRTSDDPRVAVDAASGNLYAAWSDYAFGRYAIRISESTDGGWIWKESGQPVGPESGDSYMPSVGVSPENHDLVVGFYRSVRVPNENRHTGLFKPGAGGVQTENTRYYLAVSTHGTDPFSISAVSPWFGPPDGEQAGFNGDYSSMTVVGKVAHPIWSDTRNVFKTSGGTFDDEDVFTKAKMLP